MLCLDDVNDKLGNFRSSHERIILVATSFDEFSNLQRTSIGGTIKTYFEVDLVISEPATSNRKEPEIKFRKVNPTKYEVKVKGPGNPFWLVFSGSFHPQRYRLVDQICRSATSIPANIVEGQSRNTTKEYLQFLYNARGSLEEIRYHLLLAKDLGYLALDRYKEIKEKCREISLMLNSLIKSLERKQD